MSMGVLYDQNKQIQKAKECWVEALGVFYEINDYESINSLEIWLGRR